MIVLLAVDNGLDKSVSQSVMQLKFPDNTSFQFDNPTHGWVMFRPIPDKSDPLASRPYYFQTAYVVAIMADDQPAQDAIPQMLPGLAELRKKASY